MLTLPDLQALPSTLPLDGAISQGLCFAIAIELQDRTPSFCPRRHCSVGQACDSIDRKRLKVLEQLVDFLGKNNVKILDSRLTSWTIQTMKKV